MGMTKLEAALNSWTFWLAALAVIAAALNALVPYLSGAPLTIVQDVLMLLTLLTGPHEIAKAGRTGNLR